MSLKKSGSSKKNRPSKKQESNNIAHYNAILIENLQSQFKFVTEHVDTMGQSIRGEIQQFRSEVNGRFEVIETIVREHSQILQEHGKKLEQNDKRWEQNDKRWEQNAATLSRIETKLDHFVEKVDDHEERISTLETVRSTVVP